MTVSRRAPPTRHALMSVNRRLERVRSATGLLTRKRSALVNELFLAARPVLDDREAIAWQAAHAYATLVRAEADRGSAFLGAIALPAREIALELRSTVIWGLPSAEIVDHEPVRRLASERGVAVGAAGPAATAAAGEFESLTALLLDSVSRELRIRRLARALADTTRRVNLLERRIGPALAADSKRIAAVLEEREREEQLRQRRLLGRIGRRRRPL